MWVNTRSINSNRAPINSLVCWFCMSDLASFLFRVGPSSVKTLHGLMLCPKVMNAAVLLAHPPPVFLHTTAESNLLPDFCAHGVGESDLGQISPDGLHSTPSWQWPDVDHQHLVLGQLLNLQWTERCTTCHVKTAPHSCYAGCLWLWVKLHLLCLVTESSAAGVKHWYGFHSWKLFQI